jgi:hypothetical protein
VPEPIDWQKVGAITAQLPHPWQFRPDALIAQLLDVVKDEALLAAILAEVRSVPDGLLAAIPEQPDPVREDLGRWGTLHFIRGIAFALAVREVKGLDAITDPMRTQGLSGPDAKVQ